MTLERKKRVVMVFLAAFAVWPLVHHGLVRRFGIEPWKFAGWAMYARPANKTQIRLSAVDRVGVPLSAARFSPQTRAALTTLRRRRTYYGQLASPRPLAMTLFEQHPRVVRVSIEVIDHRLSPLSDHFEATSTEYVYERPAGIPKGQD